VEVASRCRLFVCSASRAAHPLRTNCGADYWYEEAETAQLGLVIVAESRQECAPFPAPFSLAVQLAGDLLLQVNVECSLLHLGV
jgi:hypothetical protein